MFLYFYKNIITNIKLQMIPIATFYFGHFLSHSHGSVTFKVYGKMQTLTLSQPKTPEPIVTKF